MLAAALKSFQVDVFGESEIVVHEGENILHHMTAHESVERVSFGSREAGVAGWIEMYPVTAQIMCVIVLRDLRESRQQRYAEIRRTPVFS